MLNIVLFGAPGAGKGTQAALLVPHYDLTHLSTGAMLRREAAAGTPLGKSIQSKIDGGAFVSDETIMQIVAAEITTNKASCGFIFDGVPRTMAQARQLDDIVAAQNMTITAAILLAADENELIARILTRGELSGRSDDKDETIIRRRIRIYHEKTEPLIDYYSQQNKFFSLSGSGSVDEISVGLRRVIDGLLN